MGKVAVITDSTTNVPPEILEQYPIHVIPLVVNWGEESYLDGVEILPEEFYRRLGESEELPFTSQPSIKAFEELYRELADQGSREMIAVLISSRLSGTVDSALQAAQSFPDLKIEVVDSRTAAMAAGLHLLAVARAAEQGADLAACKEIALRSQKHTDVVFAVNTLEYLHRGGRIGGAKRFLGTMLNIKPILEMRDGGIEPVEQVRTQRRAIECLLELTRQRLIAPEPIRLVVIHSNVPEAAQELLERAKREFNAEEGYVAELSPVIGTHVGPGTLALACMSGM